MNKPAEVLSTSGGRAPRAPARLVHELPPRRRWPKTLPCLRCGRARLSSGPGDRFDPDCKRVLRAIDPAPAHVALERPGA